MSALQNITGKYFETRKKCAIAQDGNIRGQEEEGSLSDRKVGNQLKLFAERVIYCGFLEKWTIVYQNNKSTIYVRFNMIYFIFIFFEHLYKLHIFRTLIRNVKSKRNKLIKQIYFDELLPIQYCFCNDTYIFCVKLQIQFVVFWIIYYFSKNYKNNIFSSYIYFRLIIFLRNIKIKSINLIKQIIFNELLPTNYCFCCNIHASCLESQIQCVVYILWIYCFSKNYKTNNISLYYIGYLGGTVFSTYIRCNYIFYVLLDFLHLQFLCYYKICLFIKYLFICKVYLKIIENCISYGDTFYNIFVLYNHLQA